MKFEIFELERFQSTWENQVEYNLSESGILPMSVNELMRLAFPGEHGKFGRGAIRELLLKELGYSQTNGTIPLRRNIARMYPGATAHNVEVTNGGAEANFITMWRLLNRGDEAVIMLPNYMQNWGLAKAFGARVREWWLRPVSSRKPGMRAIWAPDPVELQRLVTKKTRLIAVCNPNNPSGAVLARDAMEEVVERARWAGAWLLADEVYQGAELEGPLTPSFWTVGGGHKAPYEKLVVTNSLSKAYGLPGLRIGWIVGNRKAVDDSWAAHDYTTIGPGAINDALATVAIAPPVRKAILERTRRIMQAQWPVLNTWVSRQGGILSASPPQAGAISLLQYSFKMNSTKFANLLRRKKSVLIVPGDHFLMDGYLRIGFGGRLDHIKAGLRRLEALLREIN
jgi:hypothetical protein